MTQHATIDSMSSKRPWSKFGTYVGDKDLTSEEAIVAAHLDWEVSKQPLYTFLDGKRQEVQGYYGVVRDVDNMTLGVVQKRYVPIQNRRKFEFIDKVLGRHARIHTAGNLKEGRIVWILARLNGIARVKGSDDTIEKFLLLSSSHDGSRNLEVAFTPLRVVCQNILNIALRDAINKVKVRHTRGADFNQAEATIKNALDFYKVFEEKANWLAEQKINTKQMDVILNTVFKVDESDELSISTRNSMDMVRLLSEQGKGNNQWRGTAWGVFNGFTEFFDHEKSIREADKHPDNRLFSSWFGNAAIAKQTALDTIERVLAA